MWMREPAPTPDIDDVATWVGRLAAATWPGCELGLVRQLLGGAPTLTYAAEITSNETVRTVVAKLTPPGAPPAGKRDAFRQTAALTACAHAPGLAVPLVLARSAATTTAPAMCLMSFLPGSASEPNIDVVSLAEPAVVARRGLAAATALAALQRVDVTALVRAGDWPVPLPAEVVRWGVHLGAIDPVLGRGYERLHDLLMASIPRPLPPVLAHGDYRLGNMLCDGDEITALIDWKFWAIGDPRLDLAWFLLSADPAHPLAQPGRSGLPTPEELLDRYTQERGRPVADLRWFGALVRYKQAAAAAQILLECRRHNQPCTIPSVEELIPGLLAAARDYLGTPARR